ncbi:MAG: hypothetical protein IT521_13525 [Burkholderiales bacterium]|nr:hypothetical protein [Burkholderiales bacterium]
MLRIHIGGPDGRPPSFAAKLLGFLLLIVGVACVVLLVLGLWIFFAIAFSVMAIVGLVRYFLSSNSVPTGTPAGRTDDRVIEGEATTLPDDPAMPEGGRATRKPNE